MFFSCFCAAPRVGVKQRTEHIIKARNEQACRTLHPFWVLAKNKQTPRLLLCTLFVVQITDKAISDIRSRPGGDGTAGSGSAGGVWGASGSAPGSGSSASGAEAGDGEDGPHTV